MRQGNTVSYLHADLLGSTSLATNSSGALITNSATRYFPYGAIRSGGSGLSTDYRFTDQRLEANAGLYDFDARVYDPYLGRFIQPDSIVPNPGNPQDLNRYSYSYSNPLKYIDPSGHFPITPLPIPDQWIPQAVELVKALAVQATPYLSELGILASQAQPFVNGAAPTWTAAQDAFQQSFSYGSLDPGNWPGMSPRRPNEDQQSYVERMLAQGFQPLEQGEPAIRKALGMSPNSKCADFVGYNAHANRWLIAESKGSDIDHALSQLSNTMNALLKQTGFTPADMELRLYTNSQAYQRLLTTSSDRGGWVVRQGYLGWWDEVGNFVLYSVNNVPVAVGAVP